jgi:O-antigen/teichoic acid export membrane protein
LSLSNKLIRGASANVLDHGLKMVVMFVTTPLMIRCLGKEGYGTWLLACAVIAYFRLLDLGVSFAGSRFLGTALGADDREEYQSLVCHLFRFFTRLGVATLVLTVVVVWGIPLFIKEGDVASTVQVLVAGLGASTALRFFTRIYEVVLKSHVRYDLIGISSILKTILQAVLIITLLLMGHGLLVLLVAHVLIDVFDQLLLAYFARRVESNLRLRGAEKKGSGASELIRYSATAMVTNAGNSLRQGMDPMIITHVSGLTSLPPYMVGTRLLGVFNDVINAVFGGGLVAAFSQLYGRGDGDALNQRFLQAIRCSTMLATLGGCGLMLFGPAFIHRWVGSGFLVSGDVVLILAPATALSLCQYPVWSLFYSQNKLKLLAALTLVGGIFNLALSFLLAWRWGWMGVVWASCVEMALAYGLVTPWLVGRNGVPVRIYLREILVPGVKIVVASALYWGAVRALVLPAYDRLFILGMGYLAVMAMVFWFVVFSGPERMQVKKMIPGLR